MKSNSIVLELFIAPFSDGLYLLNHLQELSTGYIYLQVLSLAIIPPSVNIATEQ